VVRQQLITAPDRKRGAAILDLCMQLNLTALPPSLIAALASAQTNHPPPRHNNRATSSALPAAA